MRNLYFHAHTDASRSFHALPNEYLIAAIGLDTAENGLFNVLGMKIGVQVMNRVHQVMNTIHRNVA